MSEVVDVGWNGRLWLRRSLFVSLGVDFPVLAIPFGSWVFM